VSETRQVIRGPPSSVRIYPERGIVVFSGWASVGDPYLAQASLLRGRVLCGVRLVWARSSVLLLDGAVEMIRPTDVLQLHSKVLTRM
jgi:hypothetical protein